MASELEKRSTVKMEEPAVTKFRQQVLAGDFSNIQKNVADLIACKAKRNRVTGQIAHKDSH